LNDENVALLSTCFCSVFASLYASLLHFVWIVFLMWKTSTLIGFGVFELLKVKMVRLQDKNLRNLLIENTLVILCASFLYYFVLPFVSLPVISSIHLPSFPYA
jgi:hypothetical protein